MPIPDAPLEIDIILLDSGTSPLIVVTPSFLGDSQTTDALSAT